MPAKICLLYTSLFCKVMWVHDFMALGDAAATMLRDDLVDVAMNKGLQDDDKANDCLLYTSHILESLGHTIGGFCHLQATINKFLDGIFETLCVTTNEFCCLGHHRCV